MPVSERYWFAVDTGERAMLVCDRSRRGLRRGATMRASATTSASPSWGGRCAVRAGRGAGGPPRGRGLRRGLGPVVVSRPSMRFGSAAVQAIHRGRIASSGSRRVGWRTVRAAAAQAVRRGRRVGAGSGTIVGRGAGVSPRTSRIGGPSVGGLSVRSWVPPAASWSRGRRHGRRNRIVRIT
jgi:hypothetical protein